MKSGLMLGVNPETVRQKEDFYATNPKALVLFLDRLKEDDIKINYKVWENSGVIDFLSVTEKWNGDILTNPPFKLAEKFLEKGMELLEKGNKLFLFLKIQFLEGQKRKELFKTYPPKYVYCYSSRQQCCRDAEFEKFTATTQFYAWYIWEKGFKGETILRWI